MTTKIGFFFVFLSFGFHVLPQRMAGRQRPTQNLSKHDIRQFILPCFKVLFSFPNPFSVCFLIPHSCHESNVPNPTEITEVHGKHNFSTSFFVCCFVFLRLGGPISTYLTIPHRLRQRVPNGRTNWVKLHKTFVVAKSWFVFDMERVIFGGLLCFWSILKNLLYYGWPRKIKPSF